MSFVSSFAGRKFPGAAIDDGAGGLLLSPAQQILKCPANSVLQSDGAIREVYLVDYSSRHFGGGIVSEQSIPEYTTCYDVRVSEFDQFVFVGDLSIHENVVGAEVRPPAIVYRVNRCFQVDHPVKCRPLERVDNRFNCAFEWSVRPVNSY